MVKTGAERAREYRARVRAKKPPKKPTKTRQERRKEYKERKKLLKLLEQEQLIRSSMPSISNSSFASSTSNSEGTDATETLSPHPYLELLPNLMKMDDFKLIDLVEPNAHLYDQSRKDYRNVALRKRTWESIAETMNYSTYECHKRFKYLRDKLCKLKKRRGFDGVSDPGTPKIFKRMLFLWVHLSNKRNSSSTPKTEDSYFRFTENEIKCEVELIEGEFAEDLSRNNQNNEDSVDEETSNENYVLPHL